MQKQIEAKIIADSINKNGNRCTSFVLTFPRFILAELNTHRMFSINSASSRAVPFEKMVKLVQDDPFIPIKWMKEHKGMQGSVYFTDEEAINDLKQLWLYQRNNSVIHSRILTERGVTKQICNRLLEPFMWHTAIVTATEYTNFFALRCSDAAEIHFSDLAYKMQSEMKNNEPKELEDGEWHIPFGDKLDKLKLSRMCESSSLDNKKLKIATSRCARVSYINYEGKDDYESDLKLYEQLKNSGHMSPFEHCAMADSSIGFCGNFNGFKQLRKFIPGESK